MVPPMAVISMDAKDQAVRIPRQRSPFQGGNAVTSDHVGTAKQPTELGYEILRLMGETGLRQAGLSKASGLGSSTISRVIYGEVERPDNRTLTRIAQAFVAAAGTPPGEVDTATEELHGRLMAAAGYRVGALPSARTQHPLAMELDRMIGEGTPLNADEIRFLEEMIGRLVAPYRRKLRHRAG